MQLIEAKKNDDKITGWVGIRVPSNVAIKLSKNKVNGKLEKPEDYHITIIYGGEQSQNEFTDMISSIYTLLNTVTPFTVKINKIFSFDKKDSGVPIVTNVVSDELMNLQKKICKKLDNEKISYSKKFPKFIPHVCLSYAEQEINDKKIQEISFEVNSLELWYGWNGEEIKTVINLSENLRNRLLHSTIVESLFESYKSPQFIGSKLEIETLKNVTNITKKLISELNDNNISFQQIVETIKQKHEYALKFKEVFNLDWLF